MTEFQKEAARPKRQGQRNIENITVSKRGHGMKKRVGVLMGGPSCERDISMMSGNAVFRALENKGIDAVPIELAKCPTMNGYKELVIQKIRSSNIDVAFITLHGEFGEDGRMQEILEEIDMPYTGSRVGPSRLGMNKVSSKNIFNLKNISTPSYIIIHKSEFDIKRNARMYLKELSFPIVIKPSDGGSSIGLSIVDSEEGFYAAISNAFEYDDKIIAEEYVQGREITVGILEDRPLPIVEIIPKTRFFDFKAKYEKGLTEYKIPASIDKKEHKECQRIALLAHKALGACFFSRVDMIFSEDRIPVVLEVNTIPGLTEISLLPKAAKAAGIDFDQLVLKILKSASKK
ncbi:D-alanine--D-alanine ligase [Candidatus Omnitrophota bacterium]